MVADVEELTNVDASESMLEDSTQRKFSCQNKEMKSDSREWNSQDSRRRSANIHLNSGPTCTGDVLQGDTHGFTPSDKQMTHDIAARHGFWSMSGNYTYRHHVQVSNFTCHSRYHSSILTSSGGQIRHRTYCWKIVSTTTETIMVARSSRGP